MASWEQREVVIRHTEWIIDRGTYSDEFDKAWLAAQEEWKARNPGKSLPGNWCQVDADDTHIIIRIEVRDHG